MCRLSGRPNNQLLLIITGVLLEVVILCQVVRLFQIVRENSKLRLIINDSQVCQRRAMLVRKNAPTKTAFPELQQEQNLKTKPSMIMLEKYLIVGAHHNQTLCLRRRKQDTIVDNRALSDLFSTTKKLEGRML